MAMPESASSDRSGEENQNWHTWSVGIFHGSLGAEQPAEQARWEAQICHDDHISKDMVASEDEGSKKAKAEREN